MACHAPQVSAGSVRAQHGFVKFSMNISFRLAQPEDEEFLFAVHRAAMQSYVAATWGAWEEEYQREVFRQDFRPDTLQVIQVDSVDVGVLDLEDRTEELFLITIEILPAYQRRGIGTAIVQNIIEQARRQKKPVALQVLKVNVEARSFYQRLGFGVTGENRTHYIMAHAAR